MGYAPQGAGGGGVANLSELTIDTDKDWLFKRISNAGDGLNPRDLATIRQIPGIPEIEDLIVYITGAVNRAIVIPRMEIPLPSINYSTEVSAVSGGSYSKTLGVPEPSISQTTEATSVNAVGGAVSHDDDGMDTDETTEANDTTADDMTMLQSDGATADWYALGYASVFDGIVLNISTVGVDITLDTFEYSKGSGTWGTLTPVMNQLNDYETSGKVWYTFERPGDWAVDTIAAIADKYWIKLKSSATGASYSQPLGAQAWILKY